MQAEFEKIIEKLEEELKLADEEKLRCARENPLQFDSAKGYAHGVGKAIEIVKQEAEQYEECYKDCGECEAYNKEKHHCPKFCKVIKETVKEIEENHNGWISVKERLPEKAGSYLVIGKSGGAVVTRWYEPSKFYPNGHFGGNCSNYIRYWMPRPEPPLPYQPNGEHDENTK